MGALTRSEMRDEVRFFLKNRPDTASSGLSDARVNSFLYSGLLHVAHPSIHRHPSTMHTFTVTLVDGTNQYTYNPTPESTPANIVALRSVVHVQATSNTATATRFRLRPQDAQWFDNRTLNSAGGTFHSYAVEGNDLLLDPVPTSTEAGQLLFVRAIREPAELEDGDTTDLATIWDDAVILAAVWRAQLYLGYRDLAEATKLDLASLINEFSEFDRMHGMEDFDWVGEINSDPQRGLTT